MKNLGVSVCLLAAGLLCGAPPARGCAVPVFRYALERWMPDVYELVVFHREPLDAPARTAIEAAEKCNANLRVMTVPLTNGIPEGWKPVLAEADLPNPPFAALLYPQFPQQAYNLPPVWQGRWTAGVTDAILDSPVRKEVRARLLRGTSVVWIFAESGDTRRDTPARRLLERELARLQGEVKLNEEIEPQQIRSAIPLKVEFSVVPFSCRDPAEQVLLSMLKGMEPTFASRTNEPAAFAVFGQGRCLGGLVGSNLTADAISEMTAFLTGDCSCIVKEQNPGIDLLVNSDWLAAVAEGGLIQDPGLPSLAGTTERPAAAPSHAAKAPTAAPAPAGTAAGRNLLLVLVGLLTVTALFTAVMSRRRPR